MPARRLWWTLGVLAMLLLGAGVAREPSPPLSSGPLASTVANEAIQTTYGARVQQRFTFGGFVFANDTGAPYTIQAVDVTNVPGGLTVHTFIFRVPRHGAIGALEGWVRASGPPVVVGVHQVWEPLVEVKARTVGVFTIQGVIIRYRWHNGQYGMYVPDQFTLCAGPNAHAECSQLLRPPPRQWTLWQALWANLPRIP